MNTALGDSSKPLSIRRLRKRYDNVTALDLIDLEIQAGELVTLLGPSGSGKTTLLMSIAGFAQPDAGEILIDGQNILTLAPHKRGIGVVFQQYALFPHLTVAENVAYPLRVRRRPRAELTSAVSEALRLVQLEDYAGRRPNQLSGGQQQRVALARALVFRPPVLLMDEPLGALDRKLRLEMQIEIRGIQKALGITTVYVTHDQEEALAISDRIAIMHDGRIEQIATPEAIYRRPASTFVANFVGESNTFTGTFDSPRAGQAQFRIGPNSCFQVPTATRTEADLATVTLVVRPENVVVSALAGAACPHRGRVRQISYMGPIVRVQISSDIGPSLTAIVNSSLAGKLPSAEQDIFFGWRPEDIVLVPISAASRRTMQ